MSEQVVKSDYTTRFGSFEKFNRVLYGGHQQDDTENRFFTFAGDTPIFMGASSDYSRNTWCYQAKNGVLKSGLALTPGCAQMTKGEDDFSKWFHDSSDVVAQWHHGYMTYKLTRFSNFSPDVRVQMAVYPLFPDDGFVVHYEIWSEQRIWFCAGLGGITPFEGRYEYHFSPGREFTAADCADNVAQISGDQATISGPGQVTMRLAGDFKFDLELDDATALAETCPSSFMMPHGALPQVIKLRAEIPQGQWWRGNLLVLRNGSQEQAQAYLQRPDLLRDLRGEIRKKYARYNLSTPDKVLNDSFIDTIIAQDASFHGKTFFHGAIGYHAPFLGWRGWYGAALLGWSERIKSAIRHHFATQTRPGAEPEKIYWDGHDRPDLDHEGTQYHHLENSPGHLTALLHCDDIYNMQEVAVDMTLFYLEHSGDRATAEKIYDQLCEILDWEERVLDPDGDGLYQNFLNTWISDGHSYNGAGCAQSSSYNYAANRRTAEIGQALGRNVDKLLQRAEKIQHAYQTKIWQAPLGVPAESIDTIGHKLVHPLPELSTIYLAADCGNTNLEQSYRMLRYVEKHLKCNNTIGRGGKLYFSSEWQPKKYSTCGIFPAENAALALAYYQTGLGTQGAEILTALGDAFMLSPYPGSISHVLAASGGDDCGDIDFTDVSSCYLRLLIEGLWGVRFQRWRQELQLRPQLPESWPQASLALPDVQLNWHRDKLTDSLTVASSAELKKIIQLPLRYPEVDQVFINGEIVDFKLLPGIGKTWLEVATSEPNFELKIYYAPTFYPQLSANKLQTFSGNLVEFSVTAGTLQQVDTFNLKSEVLRTTPQSWTAKIAAAPGNYDVLVLARQGNSEFYLPATIEVLSCEIKPQEIILHHTTQVPLNAYFNAALTAIHQQKFTSPRPQGYSIGMRLNGRYAWEWNHYGHNALHVDDRALRQAQGVIRAASGVDFATPATGNNCVTVSMWDNFPTSAEIPLSGRAAELAVLLSGTTHALQSGVVNARLQVRYQDGSTETTNLIPPRNFDDFLLAAYQTECETLYFSAGTHGQIVRLRLNPAKELASFKVEAIANEVIVNILALTLINPQD